MAQGATLIALGKPALANPDWPQRVAEGLPLNPFDGQILAPVADVKERELAG